MKNIDIIIITTLFIFLLSRNNIKRLYIQSKIKYRIKKDRYLVYYQSIFDPRSESIVGFEALIRQKSKNNKILNPKDFLNEIQDNNMLFELSLWTLEDIMQNYYKIHEKYNLNNYKYISMNISVEELINDEFINQIIKLTNKYKLPQNTICFEIVEEVRIKDINKAYCNINKLKEFNHLIAIDDFGVEYSNLELLEKIKFDIIKLDKYFTDITSKVYLKEEIMKFLLSVCQKANTNLIVEGIETKDQLDFINNFNDDRVYIQGFYYSKPCPI